MNQPILAQTFCGSNTIQVCHMQPCIRIVRRPNASFIWNQTIRAREFYYSSFEIL